MAPWTAGHRLAAMTRVELILRTRQLIAEGERLAAAPSLTALQTWLQLSDDLLATAWGSMDRYHLAWLLVGKPKGIVRGRPMTPDEEAAYVREVAAQKTAARSVARPGASARGRVWERSPEHPASSTRQARTRRAPTPPSPHTPPRSRARPRGQQPSATPTSHRGRDARSHWTQSSRPAWTRHAVPRPPTRITASPAPRVPSASRGRAGPFGQRARSAATPAATATHSSATIPYRCAA
jgi:hypothetical protein